MSFIVSSSSILPISAQSINNALIENKLLSEDLKINLDYNTMSKSEKKLFNQLIEEEIQKEKREAELNDELFIEEVFRNQLIYSLNRNLLDTKDLRIELYISNKIVASTINVIIGVTVGGVGAGAVSAYIRVVGKDAARRVFSKTLTTQLLAWGAPKVASTVGVIVDFILEYTDFGDKIASYLDSKDIRPNNGRFDIY